MSTDTTIPDGILRAAHKLGCDIRHHIAHSEIELIQHDVGVDQMIAKAIHDAVMAERERDQWQPIETAPKDWTDVLLYLPDEDDGTGARGVVKGWYSMADGGFDCWMSYDTNGGQCYPTKWMPLPAAPKAEG